MGRISKFSNLYDSKGKLIRKVDEKTGVLKPVNIEQLEKMIDEYPKDGNMNVFYSMQYRLAEMYRKYGNPHEQELIDRIKATAAQKTTDQQVTEKLNEVKKELNKAA